MARSADTPIVREKIVSRALTIADREGLAAVSFRRLGDELGVTPMALYHHVTNKADLLAAMLELVISEMPLPERRAKGAWVAELREFVDAFLSVARQHPCTADLLQEQPTPGQHGLRVTEAALDLLRRGGFPPATAIAIVQQLTAVLTSRAALVGTGARTGSSRDGADEAWTLVPSEQYPRVREAAAHIGDWTQLDDLTVEMLVLGVQGLLREQRRAAKTKARKKR